MKDVDRKKSDYDEMLNMERPVSRKRQPMSMRNRAAQFAPFAALTGYDAVIKETARLTESKPNLTEDQKEILSEKLNELFKRLDEQPECQVYHFVEDEKKEGGCREIHRGIIKKIDTFQRKVVFTDGKEIDFENIYDVKM